MRWNVLCLFTSALITVTAVGCKQFGKKNATMESVASAADSFVAPQQETPYDPEPYRTYESPSPVEVTYGPMASATSQEQRYHTVARHDTLYRLARTYYGDQRRWKDIYEANRATVSDPNRIRVGQRLLIP